MLALELKPQERTSSNDFTFNKTPLSQNVSNDINSNDVFYLKFLGIGRSPDEPEKFFGDSSQERFLRRQQRKGAVPQTETHLKTKTKTN